MSWLAACTPASVGQSPKWFLTVQNNRGLQEKSPPTSERKAAVWSAHRSATRFDGSLQRGLCQRETAKTTIPTPPSIKEFREQWRRKRKPTDDADKRAKKPKTCTQGLNGPQFYSKPDIPSWKFFASLGSIKVDADHGDVADGTTERQQHQAPSNQAGIPSRIVFTSQTNLIGLQRLLKGLQKSIFEFRQKRC
jgi:hypothetical protein